MVPTKLLKVDGWHRLIPSNYSRDGEDQSRQRIHRARAPSDHDKVDRLAGATDDAVQAERRGLSGIFSGELLFGVPHADIVNDAFCHPGIVGHRFNDTTRGAWYASDFIETSLIEVAYHKVRNLADIVVPHTPEGRPSSDVSLYDDWQADFRMLIHTLEFAEKYAEFLQADPIPDCYIASEALAADLMNKHHSSGILYPSVRRPEGMCLVCFRPGLVNSPRRGMRIQITFQDIGTGYSVTIVEVPCPAETSFE